MTLFGRCVNHDAAALIVFGALEPIITQVDARVVGAVSVCAVSVSVCVTMYVCSQEEAGRSNGRSFRGRQDKEQTLESRAL